MVTLTVDSIDVPGLIHQVQEGVFARHSASVHERAAALQIAFAPEVSVSCFDAVCRMIEAGMGIAVIPQSAASAYAGNARFVRRPLADPWAERQLQLYALRRTPQLRSVQALIDALRG